jgi:hypothetical protein
MFSGLSSYVLNWHFLNWIYQQEKRKDPEEAAHNYANLVIGLADCYYDNPEAYVKDSPFNKTKPTRWIDIISIRWLGWPVAFKTKPLQGRYSR